MIEESMQKCFDTFKPDFVIYNAGTDCMCGDPLGRLNISEQGIVQRDEVVFTQCLQRNVPVVMILSGGYQMTNAPVIARSIHNLNNRFSLLNQFIR